jgi:hypothetical protein
MSTTADRVTPTKWLFTLCWIHDILAIRMEQINLTIQKFISHPILLIILGLIITTIIMAILSLRNWALVCLSVAFIIAGVSALIYSDKVK